MSLFSVEKTLTLAAAKQVAEAAEKFAVANNWKVVIAVVDSGADLAVLRNGWTAAWWAAYRSPSARPALLSNSSAPPSLENGLAGGTTSLLKLDILPFEGGIPVLADGAIAGAIGVSGGTPAQDGQVAQAGVDTLKGAH